MARVYRLPHRRPGAHLSNLADPPYIDAPKGGSTPSLGVECITRKWGLF